MVKLHGVLLRDVKDEQLLFTNAIFSSGFLNFLALSRIHFSIYKHLIRFCNIDIFFPLVFSFSIGGILIEIEISYLAYYI